MAETLNTILKEETDRTAATIGKGDRDFLAMEQDLMEAVAGRIVQHNGALEKGRPKIPFPKKLAPWQIAQLLAASMDIRLHVGPFGAKCLMVYENGAPMKHETGLKQIQAAAMQLDCSITQEDLEKVSSRLMMVCPAAT